ncbi:uncharacterized protein [Solanum lycopersicum]|uniref:uncharacterized protein n=1 Tax=Solanum lycopersicum TaxID=4081 RepID=UPI000532CA03|nr:uncharacterized protein LOC104645402 [Solanum lycopersicum]
MEDQISRTIEDSINVMKDTWSKDLAEIRSLLQEFVGILPTSKPSPVEFQRFCGQNPELWISQAERYFEFHEITENHKLHLASCYLDGAALQWYQWLFENKQLVDWKHFVEKVLIRFRKCHLKLHAYSLSNLQQWRNITNSALLKSCEEKSEQKSKIGAHKVFDKRLTSNCPTDTPIERAGEESPSMDSISVELFNGHPQGESSGRCN